MGKDNFQNDPLIAHISATQSLFVALNFQIQVVSPPPAINEGSRLNHYESLVSSAQSEGKRIEVTLPEQTRALIVDNCDFMLLNVCSLSIRWRYPHLCCFRISLTLLLINIVNLQMNIPTLIPVSSSEVQKYLPQAVQLILKGHIENGSSYARSDKITITKIFKNLNVICKLNIKEVKEIIRQEPAYQQALADIYMDKKINNYMLITNYQKPMEKHFQPILEADMLVHPNEVTAVEYRIEFTLSNIAKKSVMKPIILLVFRLKSNKKVSVYYNLDQFSLLRQRVAASMRQIYGVQLRAL